MWLLNSKTLELDLHFDSKIAHCAILSHAWGENEVSFQQINGSRAEIQNHAGYIKIQKCCKQAAADGFEHVWIDTCCIDKTNSAELSEAINSMFKWYRDATECYVYLADVMRVDELAESRWFTRGWTLQELLAPASAIFFNKNWQEIGTKACLANEISAITKIPTWVLLDPKKANDEGLSVAQVMSWAAKRKTTRVEDVGYCLLGIFGVNMPMIYGEGENAFLRLQHEIIKGSTDQSLFAWADNARTFGGRGAFARSPDEFVRSGSVVRIKSSKREFSLTQKGLRIEVDLLALPPPMDVLYAFLNCKYKGQDNGQTLAGNCQLGISLMKISDNQYVRVEADYIPEYRFASVENKQSSTIFITEPDASSIGIPRRLGTLPQIIIFNPSYDGCAEHGFLLVAKRVEKSEWTGNADFYTHCEASGLKFVHDSKPGVQFLVVFGTSNFRVWSDIEITFDDEDMREILLSYLNKNISPQTTSTEDRHSRRYQARENLRDRITTPLQDGSSANVALRKKSVVSGMAQYLVKISIT